LEWKRPEHPCDVKRSRSRIIGLHWQQTVRHAGAQHCRQIFGSAGAFLEGCGNRSRKLCDSNQQELAISQNSCL
jgi:hypothetical protein